MENKSNNSIYIISFFEGAAVMATELCGSKLIAPYFGSSLYVWSSVIAITLGSLAAGYFFGGSVSLKANKKSFLVTFLLSASVFMGIMPLLSNAFGSLAIHLSLLISVVLSSFIILFVPMFLMGAASPIIIAIQSKQNDSGKVSGTVYSISTLGGIIATFLSGFFLIPTFGLYTTLTVFAVLLASSLLLISEKKNNFKIGLSLVVLVIFGFTNKTPLKNCIYQTDGVLGKLNILDDTIKNGNSPQLIIRKLLVNNVVQSEVELPSSKALSQYISILDANTNAVKSKKALVLGLGGGLTSNLFAAKGFDVTGVELDDRIIEIAQEYFFLNPTVKAVCDDARHFINQTNEGYDLILVDVFKAEEQPVHVLTIESLDRIKNVLNSNGKLFINWHGYLKDERGLGTSILLNTLKCSGFNYVICAANDKEDERNLIIVASVNEPEVHQFQINEAVQPTDLVNTDNRPLLEKYNILANQTWRKNYIQYYYSGN